VWGLELLVELVTADALSAAHAVAAAERMHAANPFFLNEALLDAFRAKLDTLARR
jgi:hypothetical protein